MSSAKSHQAYDNHLVGLAAHTAFADNQLNPSSDYRGVYSYGGSTNVVNQHSNISHGHQYLSSYATNSIDNSSHN